MKKVEVNDENFKQEVLDGKGPVMAEFYATWCGHCQQLKPTIEELAGTYSDKIKFCLVDIDQSPRYADEMGVSGTPTMFFFKNGKVVKKLVGEQQKSVIESALKEII